MNKLKKIEIIFRESETQDRIRVKEFKVNGKKCDAIQWLEIYLDGDSSKNRIVLCGTKNTVKAINKLDLYNIDGITMCEEDDEIKNNRRKEYKKNWKELERKGS